VASHWGAGMNEAAEYYRIGGPVWHRRFSHATNNLGYQTNWRFGFPQAYSVSQLRFYGWGSLGDLTSVSNAGFWRPRTEEFFHGAAARNPIPFIHLASDQVTDGTLLRSETCVIGCGIDGRLWCYGGIVAVGRTVEVNETISPGDSNALGLGRYSSFDQPKTAFSSRAMRNIATLVLGDDNDLEAVQFIKTQVFSRKNSPSVGMSSSALSADGDIWMAGIASPWADADKFPLDTSVQLPFFRRVPVTTYIDRNAELTTEDQPLRFVNYWHRETMLALTDDNRLFMTGTRSVVGSNTWQEVAGFVDTATVVDGGSGYTSNPSIVVDAPSSPNGVRALVQATVSGGVVTGLRIIEPGSGYGDTTPNVTISGGGGGTGLQVQVTVHSGQWSWASTSSTTSHCAAIDTAGRLFTWGSIAINNTFAPQSDGGLGTPPVGFNTGSNWKMPVLAFNNTGKQFARVEVGQRIASSDNDSLFGVAISIDGEVCYWGSEFVHPTADATNRWHPRLLSLDTPIGEKTFIDASVGLDHVVLLDSDGIAYTYGFGHRAGRLGRSSTTTTRIASVDQGNARFSRVFAGGNNTLALRTEELDSRGNRLNPLPYAGPPT
jgi:hypothetical protein